MFKAASNITKLQTVFLDHTGSTSYAANHIRAHAEEMLSQIPENPHPRHAASQRSQEKLGHARNRLLTFFGTPARDYALVFTANVTPAIRIAGELTPMDPKGGVYCYTQESHTSIVGLRNMVAERSVSVRPVVFSEIYDIAAPNSTHSYSLLAYPAQCSFSGERLPLVLADKTHDIHAHASEYDA
ncbi:Molybdenum cofactor sulfurase [Coemansia sp. RSA 1646]|nr:Molybdenum cofactor sulfurase [Coemansia sp. RSA 1646]KAJ1767477.1 Molybdenum cofactor sulfurase [Coemansia sp. RSA 1843]KAJ2087176.1 Molybdenum cofactor sulfurase [Coemansia sp. RSA 986]KAJ2211983.1 Molybdenum cofactor sulfurase [Coemansia sp. RSA 487]